MIFVSLQSQLNLNFAQEQAQSCHLLQQNYYQSREQEYSDIMHKDIQCKQKKDYIARYGDCEHQTPYVLENLLRAYKPYPQEVASQFKSQQMSQKVLHILFHGQTRQRTYIREMMERDKDRKWKWEIIKNYSNLMSLQQTLKTNFSQESLIHAYAKLIQTCKFYHSKNMLAEIFDFQKIKCISKKGNSALNKETLQHEMILVSEVSEKDLLFLIYHNDYASFAQSITAFLNKYRHLQTYTKTYLELIRELSSSGIQAFHLYYQRQKMPKELELQMQNFKRKFLEEQINNIKRQFLKILQDQERQHPGSTHLNVIKYFSEGPVRIQLIESDIESLLRDLVSYNSQEAEENRLEQQIFVINNLLGSLSSSIDEEISQQEAQAQL